MQYRFFYGVTVLALVVDIVRTKAQSKDCAKEDFSFGCGEVREITDNVQEASGLVYMISLETALPIAADCHRKMKKYQRGEQ